MTFASRVTDFSYGDQLEALENIDFEKILTEDEPVDFYKPAKKKDRSCSMFKRQEIDAFETEYLMGDPFMTDDDEFGFGIDEYDNQLRGGNPASGTFLISFSNLASLICSTILLHSCIRAWSNPEHYIMCIIGLFVASIIVTNTLIALIAVCLLRKCHTRTEQGSNMLKMHHAMSLISVFIMVLFCASLERFWKDSGNIANPAIQQTVSALDIHVDRNWMAFLCFLTTLTLTLGVVGNLRWPHWHEDHVAVLTWTLFASSLISVGMALFIIVCRITLFVWLHAQQMQMWAVQFSFAGAIFLFFAGILGTCTGFSACKLQTFIFLVPVACLSVVLPSVYNILTAYPFATGETGTNQHIAKWVTEGCDNLYCSDLLFASGAAGIGCSFFLVIAFASAIMVKPYFAEGRLHRHRNPVPTKEF